MKILESIKKQFDKLLDKYNSFLNHYFKKYIVDYEVMDDKVKIISSTGDYRIVKNTKGNISKLNQAIVKNKVNIQRKIDEYEATSKERFIVLIINLMAIIGFGFIFCLTFFIGSYFLFIISILSALFKLGYWDIISQNLSVIGSSYFTVDIIMPKVFFGLIVAFVLGIIKIKYKDTYLCIFAHSLINIIFGK